MKKQTQAFTLVELIVVIVILAILGTIAFISFQGYSRNSRDSVRIADINSAKKSLEIFVTKTGFYPTPDNWANITYSGAIVWTEGTLGANVTKNIQSLNKVITDPLTSNEYTYSITSSKTEYQIGSISEGGGLANNQTIYKTYAADLSKTSAVAYISGNYNEKFTKVSTGTTSWILSQPSIIATDIGNPDLANILSTKKLSYNSYGNYPHSYNTQGIQSGGFNYTNGNPIIFTGTLEELHEDNQRKLDFIINLKQAYASTDLAINPIYQDIMSVDTITNQTGAINLAITFINSNKGGIKLQDLALLPTSGTTSGGGISYTCATQPTYTHASYTAGTATQPNQTRQNTNSGNPCYYTCTDGYTGNDCSTAPIPTSITDCTGQNTPTPFSATTTYTGCDTPDIIVCSGAGTGYTISACNEGSSTASTDWTISRGKYFQWGRNKGFVYGDSSQQSTTISGLIGLDALTDTYGFVRRSNLSSPYTWANSDITNNWGNTTNTSIARQGPCVTGYHIPSYLEWNGIVTAGQWGSNGNSMQIILKLPYAGYRNRNTGIFSGGGTFGGYWSSTPVSTYAIDLFIDSNHIYSSYNDYLANGFPIRCIKN